MYIVRIFALCLSFTCVLISGNVHSVQMNQGDDTPELYSSIQLTDAEQIWLKQHPTIKVSNELDYVPFDFVIGNQPAGYSIELLNLLAQKIGIHLDYVNGYTWNQLFEQFKSGDIDLLHSLAKTEERKKLGIYSAPYMRLKNNFVTRVNSPDISNIKQLYGKTLALAKGWYTVDYMIDHHPQVRLLLVDNMEEMLDAVSKGDADATIESGIVVRYLLKKQGLNDLKVSGWVRELDREQSTKYHFMAHHDSPELISMLNKAFAALTLEEIEQLEKKWLGLSKETVREIAFTEHEKQFIEQHPVIKVANNRRWVPFDFFEQGKARGYNMDYLRVLADIIGIKLRFVQGESHEQFIQQLETKKLDVITIDEASFPHHDFALLTEPFLNVHQSLVMRKGTPLFTDYHDLNGKKLVIVKGFNHEKVIRYHYPAIHIVLVDTPAEGLRMLSFGQADAMIEHRAVARYAMKTYGMTDFTVVEVPMIPGTQKVDSLRIAIRKDWPELHALLVKAMAVVSEQRLSALELRWLKVPENHGEAILLTAEERAYLDKKNVIKFCSLPDAPPYAWINERGQQEGIAADILALFAKRLDVKFKLVPTNEWGESLKNIRERKCDILPLAIDIDTRHDSMTFTSPYIIEPFVVVSRLSSPFINHVRDLGDRPIGIVKNYAFSDVMKKENPFFNAVDVTNTEDGLLKVQGKEIYGYIDSMPAVGYLMQKNVMTDLKIAGRLDSNLNMSVASRNDEPLLAAIMQKVVDSVNEREKMSIVGKWISIKYEKGTDYVLIFKILMGGLAIIAIIIWWNRKLLKARKMAEQLRVEAEFHKKKAEAETKIAQQALKDLEEKKLELESLAVTDRLTGLFNRVRLEEALNTEYEKAKRFGHIFGVILLDIDYFKAVNDTYGHNVGDDVLISFGHILHQNTRAVDTIGRWGGEEFLIVAAETNLDGVLFFAEKLRIAIETFDFPIAGKQSASFGVAVLKDGEEIKDLIARADKALYQAKNKGRNRVMSLDVPE